MKDTSMVRRVSVIAILLVTAILASTASGQEIVFSETFDDPTLPEWEHPPEVAVVEGVLQVPAPGFAFHGGFWHDFSLTVRVRRYGEGHLLIQYRWSEDANYAVRLSGDAVAVQRQLLGSTADLASVSASIPSGEWVQVSVTLTDGTHQVALNGSSVLTATDPDPLPEGGLGFRVEGEATGEFDDLVLAGEGEALPPFEPTAKPEPSPPVEASPTSGAITGAERTWVRTGGPPGGLGYDIRYNFNDPNIWYVTDNFAGVHVSTDNGLTWQPSNTGIPPQTGPTGDAIPVFSLTVDPHNPQIIWAGTDRTGHIYRSTDGALTWQQRDNGVTIEYDGLTFRGFTVDPRSSDIVYAMGETTDESLGGPSVWGSGTGGVVYKTTNGGESWELIWGEPPPSSLARYMWIDPRDPDVLYVSTGIFDRGAVGEGDPATDPFGGLGILKSSDGGRTWNILNEENGLRMLYLGSLFMHPEHPEILLAASGHTTEGPAAVYLESLVGQGQLLPNGVYRTTDGGKTWTQVLSPPAERLIEAFSSVEICPSDPNIAYAGSDLAVYQSEDAGQTWELVSGGVLGWGPPGVLAGWPIDMQCDPRDPKRIFANNYGGGNFLSEDGGRTWQNASQGYTGSQMRQVQVDPFNPARAYAVGRSGIWRTDDGGTSWYGLRYPPRDYVPSGDYSAVALDPTRPNRLLAGNIPGASILESQTGGTSWNYRWPGFDEHGEPPPGIGGEISVIVFAPSDPNTVYAGLAAAGCTLMHEPCFSGLGVIVSQDGGTSWEVSMDEQLRDLAVIDLAVDPTSAQVVYAAAETGLFKSTDGSVTWAPVSGLPYGVRVRAVAVSPGNPQRLMAGVEGLGIYTSTDAGGLWQESSAGLEPNNSLHDIVFDPTNSEIVYASDQFSGVYRSSNGGQTWTRINSGLRTRAATGLAVSADGQHLYVATNGEGVFRLDLSGEPPEPATQAAQGAPTATSKPSEVQATAPTEGVLTPTPVPAPGGGICTGAAALPLALLGLVWISRRRS